MRRRPSVDTQHRTCLGSNSVIYEMRYMMATSHGSAAAGAVPAFLTGAAGALEHHAGVNPSRNRMLAASENGPRGTRVNLSMLPSHHAPPTFPLAPASRAVPERGCAAPLG